jgi:transposase
VVERAIRPIALNRKNALFAGSDGGGEHWAVIASLVETCKLNAVDPQAYLADVITRIVTGHPQSQIDELLPWAYAPQALKAVARKRRLRCRNSQDIHARGKDCRR